MKKVKLFKSDWIFEGFLPGERKEFLAGFAVKKQVYSGKSKFQTFDIFDTYGFGRIFFLDGLIQLSTVHEAVYHEMLVHPALMQHPNPKRVLIIGGGDGGALREVLKHPVQEAVLVEIDEEVIRVAKKYLPSVSDGAFGDKRSRIVIEDGIRFLEQYEGHFDCIILDSNDPDGVMAEKLFQEKFFRAIKRALTKNGIFEAQTGYLSDAFGVKARTVMQKVFPYYELHRAFVGTFTREEHSFPVASAGINISNTNQKTIRDRYRKRKLRTSYYSPEMHAASSVLPRYFSGE